MRDYTTYKAGGKALGIVIPDDVRGLIKLLKFLKDNKIKHKILGNGSNLIFSDSLYNGILIKLDNFNKLEFNDNYVTVGAGYPLTKLALRTARRGLTGLECASGIPGTVGGAIYINAGAYKMDMGYITTTVKVLDPNLEIKILTNQDLDFHYRSSFLQKVSGYICLEATLLLRKGHTEAIMEVIKDRKQRRIESQPLEYPSAGSVFRNPDGDYAGRLIEFCGLKGARIGGAEVSEKHANFVINKENASSKDVHDLICYIHDTVLDKTNVDLQIEQEFIGWE
jgi:UDP-N-acetylmuramate dehydrogenase